MNRARKGARFENLCRRELEANGWLVTRSAASRGAADLVASRREGSGRPRLIWVQAKSGTARLDPAEWNALFEAATSHGAVPVLADQIPRVAAPRWWRMTGPKSGRREPQPRVPFDIEGWAADAV